MSASETAGFGGIGTGPQTPDRPSSPFRRAWRRRRRRPCTSRRLPCRRDRRPSCRSTWQAVQPDFLIRSSPASAAHGTRREQSGGSDDNSGNLHRYSSQGMVWKAGRMVPERTADRHLRRAAPAVDAGHAASSRVTRDLRSRAPRASSIGGRHCVPRQTHAPRPVGGRGPLTSSAGNATPATLNMRTTAAASLERALPSGAGVALARQQHDVGRRDESASAASSDA